MRGLIDTHTLVWAADDPPLLGPSASVVLHDLSNDLFLSVGTIWELSIKVGSGKMTISKPYRQWIEEAILDLDLILLPITIPHAEAQANLPHHHRDPFGLLIAQAIVEGMPIVSADAAFDQYGVARIW